MTRWRGAGRLLAFGVSQVTVDAPIALHTGQNTLMVKVTNAWMSRLIGDAPPDVKEKIAFMVEHPYKAKSKLLAGVLLGAGNGDRRNTRVIMPNVD